jgi:hypothetical protein
MYLKSYLVRNSDAPTAYKSNHKEQSFHSREMGAFNLRSPAKFGEKIQEAKKSINTIISEVSNKKIENLEAIERVRGINADALS